MLNLKHVTGEVRRAEKLLSGPEIMFPVLERPDFVAASPAMQELLATAEQSADSTAKVVITGESGVGKDVVARYIHSCSSRRRATAARAR